MNDLNRRTCMPVHPGALLDDVMMDSGLTKTQIAETLSISRQHLYDITHEKKPITPKIAARIGKLFGNGAGLWLRMQAEWDAYQVERTEDLSHIMTIKAA